MTNNIVLKIPFVSLYNFGRFIRWRYKPVSVILFQDRLVVNYLGFIKVRDIPLRDIEEAIILEKKWVNVFLIAIRMNYPLMIVYKKGSKSKTDYIVGREEIKLELLRHIQEKMNHHE